MVVQYENMGECIQEKDLMYFFEFLHSHTMVKGFRGQDDSEAKHQEILQYFRFWMQHKKMPAEAVSSR